MQSKNALKCYPLNQSPLYRLRGIRQFEKAINVKWDQVDRLLSSASYHVWLNEQQREIQQPIGWLSFVHKRIAWLFRQIELPNYLYSQKGRSYVDNARQHIGATPLVKTDINKFYPSTTWAMVYRMFTDDFKCAKDISRRLANICCYKQKHLPTGSPISGYVAFFAAKKMFDDIKNIALENKSHVTVYVDDVTISGARANKKLLSEVRKLIKRHGFITKKKKSKTFSPTSPKPVTGVIVSENDLRLPNKRHKKIWEARKALARSFSHEEDKRRVMRSLRGCLLEASQILKTG